LQQSARQKQIFSQIVPQSEPSETSSILYQHPPKHKIKDNRQNKKLNNLNPSFKKIINPIISEGKLEITI